MNKRDRLRMDRALSRAPEIGKAPLAPPRSVLWRVRQRDERYQRMSKAVNDASIEAGKWFLKEEDLRMRIAYLEKKLATLDHPAD